MTSRQLTRAALLAAALVAAAPSPSRADDPRGSQLIQLLMLLKGATQVQRSAAASDDDAGRPMLSKPTRPAVAAPQEPVAVSATVAGGPVMVTAAEALPLSQ